jgi:CysZ protein
MVLEMTRPSPIPAFSARPGLGDVFQGLALLGRSLGLIFRSPGLLGLSVLCGVVTLMALGGLLFVLGVYTPDLLGALWTRPEAWWGKALWYLALVLTFALLLVVGVSTVIPVVLAPLQDPLSEKTEELCGDFTAPPFRPGAFLKGIVTSVGHTLARVLLLLAGLGVLLPLHLVPGVGSVAWTVLATLWSMTWMAGEHLAAPMTRHLYPFREVVRTLRARWLLCLGFGAGVYVLLWVPVLNALFLPVAVVGGTLLYRGLRLSGQIPPPPALGPGK